MKPQGLRWFFICLLLLSITGCASSGSGTDGGGSNGGGNGVTDPDPDPDPDPEPEPDPLNFVTAEARADYLGSFNDAFQIVRNTARDGGLTQVANLPTPGASNYDGYMELGFFSTPNASIRGTAALTVDMQTGATTGTATGFMGPVLDQADVTQIVSFEGDVTLSGGAIGTASNGAATFSLLINGALDNGLQSFSINGQLKGFLYGSTADGIVVSGGSNALKNDITTIVDGTPVDGSATLWALVQ